MARFVKLQDRSRDTVEWHGPLVSDVLIGEWRNTNTETDGVASVTITRHGTDLRIRVYRTGDPGTCDWGETPINELFASAIDSGVAIAFTASYEFPHLRSELQANIAKGLLIISTLNAFTESRHSDYFSREFFFKSNAPDASHTSGEHDVGPSASGGMAICLQREEQVDSQPPSTRPEPPDNSLFVGTWSNTDASSSGIIRVQFCDRPGGPMIHFWGAGDRDPIDWGERPLRVFADRPDSRNGTKLATVFDFDFMQVRMHGWIKLGVLVIAVFNQFTDGSGRSNYFDREFFHAVRE